MLRRLSILASLLVAACVPAGGPNSTANCHNNPPTKAEAMAWRSAQRSNSAKSYRAFINSYPKSCYVPAAASKISGTVQKKPAVVRNVPKTSKPAKEAGGGSKSY